MRAVVYVLAYDDASEARALEEYGGRAWARVVRLPADAASPGARYMEGAAFLSLLPSLRDEWRDADFVGTLSWRASDKIRIPPNFEDILREVRGSDVVALLPSTEKLLPQAVRSHPRFLECWVPLLLRLGVRPEEAVRDDVACFFCNYWLATPRRMDEWLAWFARAVQVLDSAPEVQDALWSPSGYGSRLSPERLAAVYGVDYLPMMPFVAERLAPFWCSHTRAVVAALPLGRLEFWRGLYRWEHEDTARRAVKCINTLVPPRADETDAGVGDETLR